MTHAPDDADWQAVKNNITFEEVPAENNSAAEKKPRFQALAAASKAGATSKEEADAIRKSLHDLRNAEKNSAALTADDKAGEAHQWLESPVTERWRDIKTHPKNQRFLVFFPEAGGQIKTWYQGNHEAPICTTWEDGKTIMYATYWMPLPPPPAQPDGGGEDA